MTEPQTPLSDLAKEAKEYSDFVAMLGQRAHASVALVSVSRIEVWLELIIDKKMPHLNPAERKELYGRLGPLQSLYAKTLIAFGLGLISAELRETIDTFRDIRNKFAHPKSGIPHFDDKVIIDLVAKLPKSDPTATSNFAVFVAAWSKCLDDLEAALKTTQPPLNSLFGGTP